MLINKFYSFLRILFILLIVQSSLFSITNKQFTQLELKIKQIQKDEEFRLNRDLYNIIPKTTKSKSDIKNIIKEDKKESKYCWNIKHINLDGVTKLTTNEELNITKNYINRCVKLNEIDLLINDITNLYINKGYISSRVYIKPHQNLKNDTLKLLVLEGKISDIIFTDNDNNKSVNINNIFPNMVNNYLNLRDIEQGLEQINRLQSNSSIMQIRPSTKVGNSNIVVYNENIKKWYSSINVDNLGSESTGRDQLGVSFGLDNPFNYNDNIGATYSGTIPFNSTNKSESTSLNYNIPYGYYTFFIGSSISKYSSKLTLDSNTSINSTGKTINSFIKADKVIYRDKNSKINTAVNLTLKSNKNYLDNIFLSTSSDNLSVINFNINYFLLLDNSSTINTSLSYYQGLDNFGATKDTNNTSLDSEFKKYNLNISYMKSLELFGLQSSISNNFSFQQSDNSLYSSEQISIGGLYSVRGFEGVSVSGNKGFVINNDFSIMDNIGNINSTFFIGYDYGRIYHNYDIIGAELSGGAYGLKFLFNNISFEITKVFDITHSSSVDISSNKGNYTYVSLQYSF